MIKRALEINPNSASALGIYNGYLSHVDRPEESIAQARRALEINPLAVAALDSNSNRVLRADSLGIFQAIVGLWQILARQGQIPSARWNNSWQRVINPFTSTLSSAERQSPALNVAWVRLEGDLLSGRTCGTWRSNCDPASIRGSKKKSGALSDQKVKRVSN